MKKPRKAKGYYSGGDISKEVSGGDYLTEGDRLALKKAGLLDKQGDRSIEMAEYRARQDAAEKASRRRRRAPTPTPPASTVGSAAGSALAQARNAPPRSEERSRSDRAPARSQASTNPFEIDMRRMSDPIREYQRTHDRFGRKLDENGRPLDYAGNPIMQKKGGRVKKMAGGGSPAEDVRQKREGVRKKESLLNRFGKNAEGLYDALDRERENLPAKKAYDAFFGGDGSSLAARSKKNAKDLEDAITGNLRDQGEIARGKYKAGGKVTKMAKGGAARSYKDMDAGSGGGMGRIEKTAIAKSGSKIPAKYKKGGKVKKMAFGGMSMGAPMSQLADRAALARQSGDMNRAALAQQPGGMPGRVVTNPGFPQSGGMAGLSPIGGGGTPMRGSRNMPGRGGGKGGPSQVDKPEGGGGLGARPRGDIQTAMKKGGKVKKMADGGLSLGDRLALERAGFDTETRMKRGALYGASPVEKASLPAPKKKAPASKAMDSEMSGARMTPSQRRGAAGETIRSYGKDPKKAAEALTKLYGRKMAKGGKAEAFEGSAKDMAQDKKLAKKYGMSKKAYEKSPIDAKHDKQRSMKGLNMGGKAGYAAGGMSTAQDGMKAPLRPKPTAMAKGGKAEMHDKGCKCMKCGGMAKYAKGGKVTFGSMKPLPGTKTVGPMRPTTATGASMKKDGMKGQLRAKASGAKPTKMMKPLGMTKMASGGKVRGTGIAQRGTKFIGEV